MPSTPILVGLLRDRQLSLGDKQRAVDEALRQKAELVEQIRTQIEAGEPSDDPIFDYCILCFKSADEPVVSRFRELDSVLRKHQGQYVMVAISYQVEPFRLHHMLHGGQPSIGIAPPPGPDTRYILGLGVLTGDGLKLDEQNTREHWRWPIGSTGFPDEPPARLCLLPTNQYAEVDEGSDSLVNGRLPIDGRAIASSSGQELLGAPHRIHFSPDKRTQMLLVGDEMVLSWLRKHAQYRLRGAMLCEMVGRPTDAFPEYERAKEQQRARQLEVIHKLAIEVQAAAGQATEKAGALAAQIQQALRQSPDDPQLLALAAQYDVPIPPKP